MRAIAPISPALSDEEQEEAENLAQEFDELDSMSEDELTDENRARLAEVKARIDELDAKQPVYSDGQKAKAGAFVSVDHDGGLLVERGYRRHADIMVEQQASVSPNAAPADDGADNDASAWQEPSASTAANDDDSAELPDRLMTELTAYHSLGMRNAMASDSRVAYLAVLHTLSLRLFYRYSSYSCLQIEAKDALVPAFSGLSEFKAAREIAARHEQFEKMLPNQPGELWDFLFTLDSDTQDALFAHCAGLTINAVHEAFARGSDKRRHALQLASALQVDMGEQASSRAPRTTLRASRKRRSSRPSRTPKARTPPICLRT